jgi:HlyD family secretion protein
MFTLLGAAALAWRFGPQLGAAKPVNDTPLFQVKKGPLAISVIESGTVRSSQAVTLKCEVEGRTTILWIIDEGTHVKAGDMLIELDSSELADRKIDQEIRVQNSRALYINSRESLEIIKQQAEADISAAQLGYDFAVQDITNYEEGDYLQDLKKAQADITLADSQLVQSRDKLAWSRKLAEEGFITQTELKGDLLAEQKAQIDLEMAQGRLHILEKFTHTRKKAELVRDAEQKKFLLARTRHRANSNIIDAEADLVAKEAMLKREEERLVKITEQIAKCKLAAPVDGMVVYATSGRSYRSSNTEPLAQGVEVREQMELIRLPTAQEMVADVKVHESLLEKVRPGMPVRITTEALPGKGFAGRVSKIALLPDSQSMFMNPDLKVYNTEIEITGEVQMLRPGMSCSAEILVDQYPQALYVPIQSVLRVKGQPTVYVMGSDGVPKPRTIQVGLDNNRMIHVLSGLEEREQVLLAPPLPPSTLRESQIGSTIHAGTVPGPVGNKVAGSKPEKPPVESKPNSSDKDRVKLPKPDKDPYLSKTVKKATKTSDN